MLKLNNFEGRPVYVNGDMVLHVNETDAGSRWHGTKSIVHLVGGSRLECGDDAASVCRQLEESKAPSTARDTALLQQALDALEYHVEQTRPITSTGVIIDMLRKRLGLTA